MINFVFERNWHFTDSRTLATHRLFLITHGEGVFSTSTGNYDISKGDVFIVFQASEFTLINTNDLQFYYVSYVGKRSTLLHERIHNISTSPVFHSFDKLIPFWKDSITRAQPVNIDLVAESVLYYALSYLSVCFPNERKIDLEHCDDKKQLLRIKEYIDHHFLECDISVKNLSKLFGYNDKYLGRRLVVFLGVGVSTYIKQLRMQYAKKMINSGYSVISNIAQACGYQDPLYFSRVFKEFYGCSPSEMLNRLRVSGEYSTLD